MYKTVISLIDNQGIYEQKLITKKCERKPLNFLSHSNKTIIKYQYLNSKQSGLHHTAHTTHATHIWHCWLVFWNFSNHTFCC